MAAANNSQATPSGPASEVRGDAPADGRHYPSVSPTIMRRYLKVDDSYLFPDRTVAFVDKGNRIRVHTDNKDVMHSVVAIAHQRGWQTIEVRGSEAFRRGMWREAGLQGIDARGYAPNEIERDQLARALDQQAQATTHGAQASNTMFEPKARVDSTHFAEAQQSSHSGLPAGANGQVPMRSPKGSRHTRDSIVGTFVAAAAAPYKFDPAQRMSYYVTVRTEHGDRTVWGADLERALVESASKPEVGSSVVLLKRGSQAVNVSVAERNEAGERLKVKKVLVQRNRWALETQDHMRVLKRASEMVRSGTAPPQSVLDAVPNLMTAAAGMKLAQEYARRVTGDAISQQRLLDAIHERLASAVEHGEDIHLPSVRGRASQDHTPHRQRGGRAREKQDHERT